MVMYNSSKNYAPKIEELIIVNVEDKNILNLQNKQIREIISK